MIQSKSHGPVRLEGWRNRPSISIRGAQNPPSPGMSAEMDSFVAMAAIFRVCHPLATYQHWAMVVVLALSLVPFHCQAMNFLYPLSKAKDYEIATDDVYTDRMYNSPNQNKSVHLWIYYPTQQNRFCMCKYDHSLKKEDHLALFKQVQSNHKSLWNQRKL